MTRMIIRMSPKYVKYLLGVYDGSYLRWQFTDFTRHGRSGYI